MKHSEISNLEKYFFSSFMSNMWSNYTDDDIVDITSNMFKKLVRDRFIPFSIGVGYDYMRLSLEYEYALYPIDPYPIMIP